jgi:hypothetical protein
MAELETATAGIGLGEHSGVVAVSLREETLDEQFLEAPSIQMYLLT